MSPRVEYGTHTYLTEVRVGLRNSYFIAWITNADRAY